MIRRRISLTRIVEMFFMGTCPEGAETFRLSCLTAERPCQC